VASAAFFDLDRTLLTTSCSLAFGGPMRRAGLLTRRALVRGAWSTAVYAARGADHARMEGLRSRVAALTVGWREGDLRAVVEANVARVIPPLVYPEGAALLARHRAAGDLVVVVSSSGAEIVEPVARLLGADLAIATRMAVRDGIYTGEIDYYAYGETKAEALRTVAAERGLDLAAAHAYSDSVTDLPMLQAVGRPVAVNPDRALRAHAAASGWPVLDLVKPPRRQSSTVPPVRQ